MIRNLHEFESATLKENITDIKKANIAVYMAIDHWSIHEIKRVT